MIKLACLLTLALATTTLSAQPATTIPVRQLKYPPKTARTFRTDAEIALARQNIAKYPAAKKLADGIIAEADEWLAWSDDDLRLALTSSEVPRAFAVSASGCPVCGDKIKEKGGDYAWIIDPKVPFKIKCPVDGTVFPTNDYASYYKSGLKEKKDWTGEYVDDGWGWTNPKTGEKFWFVAYYNHCNWHKYLVPGLKSLADAYQLTGDEKYAKKAGVMLRRIAEVYPAMDHAKQSRYGQMSAARGIDYSGKVVNHIWETGLAVAVADAYDAVFDALSPEDRAFIDANFIEDAIDAVFDGKIRGNFGMHQSTLVHLAQIRQTGETDKWFDYLLNESSPTPSISGLNYALYNLVSRDGFPSETSPGYNYLWVAKIAEYGELLTRAGRDVYAMPRTRRLFDAVLAQVNAGEFTPSLGDTQSVYGGLTGADAKTFVTAYRYYKDPRYLGFIARNGDANFKSLNSLYREPIEIPADVKLPPAKSRLLDGYGLAILNDPADKTSLSLTYGQKHGHGHFDRLSFELFANGVPIMPDLGYPDAMNEFVPGIYTWSKNTISHNTAVVDQQRQPANVPGEVTLFADSPWARVVDVKATGTYPQCSIYRRAIIMVDCGGGNSYFVDVFNVIGGKQHDYSLHGPPGEFEMIGGDWSPPAKGTLAGENVALGEIYDDPVRGAKGYNDGFGGYTGSGFQHLFNVRTLDPKSARDGWIAQWKHEKDPHAMLRIRMLNEPDTKMMLADAHVSPAKYPQILKYLIARRQGENVASRFVSVIEPFKDDPFIASVRQLPVEVKDASGFEIVRRDGGSDIVIYNPEGDSVLMHGRGIESRALVTVVRFDANGNFNNTFRAFGDSTPAGEGMLTGKVGNVLPDANAVQVRLKGISDEKSLVGKVIHFRNDFHRIAYTVADARRVGESDHIALTLVEDLRVGVAILDRVERYTAWTSTALPLAPTYAGTSITDDKFSYCFPIKEVSDGKIVLAKEPVGERRPQKGDKIWLLGVGTKDTVEIPLTFWKSEKPHDNRK